MITTALIQFFILYLIIFFQKKFNFLIDSNKNTVHKIAFKSSVPLTGALYFCISVLFFSLNFFIIKLFIISSLFFLIYSFVFDDNNQYSPKVRFIIQSIFLVIVIIYFDIRVNKFNLEFIDSIKSENIFFDYFLTLFCLMVLINGSNFIDGKNGLCSGYFLLVNFFMMLVLNQNLEDTNYYNIIFRFLTISCLIFYLFNLFGKTIMGDGGVFSISILTGCSLINVSNSINFINPFFIFSLLILPCAEVLNSIIRRFLMKKNPSIADSDHLHHKIYLYLNSFSKIRRVSNSLTGIIYNIYFVFFFTLFYFNYDNPTYLIFLSSFMILIYVIVSVLFISRKNIK
jgi:UDP-N-acetylmuramyl pentapeptide phosphotransferase/UDP-N-acetylglucosamine-1-phosphate transferase